MAATSAESTTDRFGVAARATRMLGSLGLEGVGPLALAGTGLLSLAVFFGGGTRTGFAGDVVLQLACVPGLIAALFLHDPDSRPPSGRIALFCLLLIAVPLVQLIPLPAWLWTRLPGRGLAAETYSVLGESIPWHSLSLAPRATWLALTSLIVPITIVLLVARMNYVDRRAMAVATVVLTGISSVVGLVQIAGGAQSPFRFYAITNLTDAVGFFANRNHFADLMCAGILLLAPFAIPSTDRKSERASTSQNAGALYAAVGVAGILFLGALSGSKSRAGLVLGTFSFLSAVAIILRQQRAERGSAFVKYGVIAATAVMLVIVPLALSRTADRFQADPLQDGRVVFSLKTLQLAFANLPFGSGMGSFQPVYSMNEAPQDMILNTYLNRAHDDPAEVLLEAGLLALVPLALFLLWYVRRAVVIWTRPLEGAASLDTAIAKASTLVLLVVAAHSLLDYPLRTGAIMAVVAMCVGIMTPTIPAMLRKPAPERVRKRRAPSPNAAVAMREPAAAVARGEEAEAALRAAVPKVPRRTEPAAPYAYSPEATKTFDWPEVWQDEPKPHREGKTTPGGEPQASEPQSKWD